MKVQEQQQWEQSKMEKSLRVLPVVNHSCPGCQQEQNSLGQKEIRSCPAMGRGRGLSMLGLMDCRSRLEMGRVQGLNRLEQKEFHSYPEKVLEQGPSKREQEQQEQNKMVLLVLGKNK